MSPQPEPSFWEEALTTFGLAARPLPLPEPVMPSAPLWASPGPGGAIFWTAVVVGGAAVYAYGRLFPSPALPELYPGQKLNQTKENPLAPSHPFAERVLIRASGEEISATPPAVVVPEVTEVSEPEEDPKKKLKKEKLAHLLSPRSDESLKENVIALLEGEDEEVVCEAAKRSARVRAVLSELVITRFTNEKLLQEISRAPSSDSVFQEEVEASILRESKTAFLAFSVMLRTLDDDVVYPHLNAILRGAVLAMGDTLDSLKMNEALNEGLAVNTSGVWRRLVDLAVASPENQVAHRVLWSLWTVENSLPAGFDFFETTRVVERLLIAPLSTDQTKGLRTLACNSKQIFIALLHLWNRGKEVQHLLAQTNQDALLDRHARVRLIEEEAIGDRALFYIYETIKQKNINDGWRWGSMVSQEPSLLEFLLFRSNPFKKGSGMEAFVEGARRALVDIYQSMDRLEDAKQFVERLALHSNWETLQLLGARTTGDKLELVLKALLKHWRTEELVPLYLKTRDDSAAGIVLGHLRSMLESGNLHQKGWAGWVIHRIVQTEPLTPRGRAANNVLTAELEKKIYTEKYQTLEMQIKQAQTVLEVAQILRLPVGFWEDPWRFKVVTDLAKVLPVVREALWIMMDENLSEVEEFKRNEDTSDYNITCGLIDKIVGFFVALLRDGVAFPETDWVPRMTQARQAGEANLVLPLLLVLSQKGSTKAMEILIEIHTENYGHGEKQNQVAQRAADLFTGVLMTFNGENLRDWVAWLIDREAWPVLENLLNGNRKNVTSVILETILERGRVEQLPKILSNTSTPLMRDLTLNALQKMMEGSLADQALAAPVLGEIIFQSRYGKEKIPLETAQRAKSLLRKAVARGSTSALRVFLAAPNSEATFIQ